VLRVDVPEIKDRTARLRYSGQGQEHPDNARLVAQASPLWRKSSVLWGLEVDAVTSNSDLFDSFDSRFGT
jgi:hypothetical protein